MKVQRALQVGTSRMEPLARYATQATTATTLLIELQSFATKGNTLLTRKRPASTAQPDGLAQHPTPMTSRTSVRPAQLDISPLENKPRAHSALLVPTANLMVLTKPALLESFAMLLLWLNQKSALLDPTVMV